MKRLGVLSIAAFLISGCGGGGAGSSASTVPQPITAHSPAPGASSTPPAGISVANPALVTYSGQIVALGQGQFQLNAGYPHGYVWIAEANGMTVTGGNMAAGAFAEVAGTVSGSQFTAIITSIWSSLPQSTTVSGTVVAGTPYGFTLYVDAAHPSVPIVLASNTVIAGGTLQVGSTVTVTGPGDPGNAIVAVQIVVATPTTGPPTPTPAPIAQTHLLTGDYLGAPWGSGSVTFAQAAPHVTWAQSNAASAGALHAVGIKAQLYADPNRTVTGDPMHTSDSTTYATTCTGTQITTLYKTITQFVMNPGASSMQTLFHNTMLTQIGTSPVDVAYVDDSGPLSGFPQTFNPSLPCNYSDAAWVTGGIAIDNASPVPVLFNGLNALNGHSPSLSIGLLDGSNTIGGNFEHCYSDSSANPKVDGWFWTATENTELQVLAKNKLFECMLRNSATAETSYDARIYALASFLLTYDPKRAIYWEQFATASGLHVLPETGLVALDPVVVTPTDVSGLLQTGGAYGREFKRCFLAGSFVGPCAVAVNPTSSAPATFPFPQYRHTLVPSGGDALDGGTISTSGPPPPTSLPALGSAIVFP